MARRKKWLHGRVMTNPRPAAVTIVATHYKEDYSWACNLLSTHPNLSIVIYDCRADPLPDQLLTSSQVTVLDKSGALAPVPFFYGVFDYCERFYHALPELIFFLHGHDQSWHQRLSIADLLRMAGETIIADPTTEYLALNDQVYEDWFTLIEPQVRSHDPCVSSILHNVTTHWPTLRALLDEPQGTAPPAEILEIHAAQAVVARCRIRDRPRVAWARLREYTRTLRFHTPADFALEGSFHRILGEPWCRPFIREHVAMLMHGGLNELELKRSFRVEAERAQNEAAMYGFADDDDAVLTTPPSTAVPPRPADADALAARVAAARQAAGRAAALERNCIPGA